MPDFVRTLFADRPPHGKLVRFELRQAYERHTLAIVDMTVDRLLLRTIGGVGYPETMPVQITWGRSATERSTFYGYVNHSEILAEDSAKTTVRHLCLGTSLRMNSAEPRSWTGPTPSFIAAEIARKHRLRALVHRSRRKLPAFTITTETDFRALQRLAEDTGYRAWVDGATLHFLDPSVLVHGAATSFVPVYDRVTAFRILKGSLVPRDSGVVAEQIVNGRSAITNLPFKVRSNTRLKERATDLVGQKPFLTTVLPGEVGTYAEGVDRVQAASRRLNWLTATVKLPGAPRVRPGRLVSIDGTGLPIEHSGVWQVESTRHVIDLTSRRDDAWITEVEISRNQGDRPVFTRTAQLSGAPDEIGCIRREGVFWESESLNITHLN